MARVIDITEGQQLKDKRARGKTSLVLTGGGFVGAVYQIGALRALDLLGVNHTVNDFDMYVGTSCGAFVGSLIANGCRPEDLMAMLDGEERDGYEPLDLRTLLRPNYRELIGTGMRLPFRSAGLAKDVLLNLGRLSLVDILTMVADLAPGGFYSLEGMTEMLDRQLSREGFSNDFRDLAKELFIVATDLDTCEPVVFGEKGWDDIPIAKAAAASAALPLVYAGVEIRGREFVDGGLRSFANVETAVANGAKLVIIVNSIVPFENERLHPNLGQRSQRVSDMGLANVGAQMFKCLVWSAMHERLSHWRVLHPDVDFILIEPRRDDALMFGTQIMNVSQRVQIARHGFESVTEHLAGDFEAYKEICARHGINISRRNVIEAMGASKSAESGTTRWRRILERRTSAGREA